MKLGRRGTIDVDLVSKRYEIYKRSADRLLQTLWRGKKDFFEAFWALKDVSLQIQPGDTVGIVGRNGSGKSTLLRVIAGVLHATQGRVTTEGRVAALLELGAGFDPSFSGLDNVFINAALIGMTKEEVNERLESIINFAEIGMFVHQPVRTYSSGMYIRLAFSVAINCDPDILIIDEALAVGDEAFQRKCFSRLRWFQERGKTILFVSHSAQAVMDLCDRAVLMEKGQILLDSDPKTIITAYQQLLYSPPANSKRLSDHLVAQANNPEVTSMDSGETQTAVAHATFDEGLRPTTTVWYEDAGAEISDARTVDARGERVNVLIRGEIYAFAYRVTFSATCKNVRFGMLIKSMTGVELGGANSAIAQQSIKQVTGGTVLEVVMQFRCSLSPGTYFLNAGVLGETEGEERYLHRGIDCAMLRVSAEASLLMTGTIDFEISTTTKEIG